jgi:hypothetical protein
MAFTESDLNVSQAEIDEVKAGLANTGQANPFPNAMAEAETKVRDWTSRYVVPEDTLKRLWRPLTLFALYTLVGDVGKSRKDAYDEAMKELTDIRDGKFQQYAAASPQPSGFLQTSGNWGSKTRIS